MPAQIRCMLIIPDEKRYTPVILRGKTLITPVRRAIRATEIGHQHLCNIDDRRLLLPEGQKDDSGGRDGGPTPLMVAADAKALERQDDGFRFRLGGDATAGRALLFGRGLAGGMIDCPVDRTWLERQIVWLTAEEALAAE